MSTSRAKRRTVTLTAYMYGIRAIRPIRSNIMIKFEAKRARRANGDYLETPKGIAIEHVNGVIWLPKSKILINQAINPDNVAIEVPEWLAKNKKMI